MFYHFLIHLFAYEFVYDESPQDTLNDKHFDKYLNYLLNQSYILSNDDKQTFQINPNYSQQISVIVQPFEQYARAYLTIYEQENTVAESNLSTIIKLYQKQLLTKLDPLNISSILASSSNVINNALRVLNQKTSNIADIQFVLRKIFPLTSTNLRAKL